MVYNKFFFATKHKIYFFVCMILQYLEILKELTKAPSLDFLMIKTKQKITVGTFFWILILTLNFVGKRNFMKRMN